MSAHSQPLAIAGLGMVSCLGQGAERNAAAMRCDYDGFQPTPFMQPYHAEPQIGAMVALAEEHEHLRGIRKLAYLGQAVINEATRDLTATVKDNQQIQLLMCLPDTQQHSSYLSGSDSHHSLLQQIQPQIDIQHLHAKSGVYHQGRCGFTQALRQAQTSLYQQQVPYVLIVGIDSLLNNAALSYYGGGLYGEHRRLLGEGHSNGFIPGEAATAVLVKKATGDDAVLITGIGISEEPASLNQMLQADNDAILKGKGLASAINQAAEEAGVAIHDTACRVASVSGEDYFFTEAALAQIKTLKKTVPEQPLWHPADSIGEVGAAVGGAITIMMTAALNKHYAPGPNILCHISNDDAQRGAFILQKQPGAQAHG